MYVFINYRKHINLFHPLQHDISLSPRGLVFFFRFTSVYERNAIANI